MQVIFVWQRTCKNCKQLKRNNVLKRLKRVFGGLPDVWWQPKEIPSLSPKAEVEGHTTHRHRLTTERGQIVGDPLIPTDLRELKSMVDELYTPLIVLVDGDVHEEVDVIDAVGADPDISYTDYDTDDNAVDAITETPGQATRILVNRVFRFYTQHCVNLPTTQTRELRRPKHPNPSFSHHLKPQRKETDNYDVAFDTQGWIEAFTRAREPEY